MWDTADVKTVLKTTTKITFVHLEQQSDQIYKKIFSHLTNATQDGAACSRCVFETVPSSTRMLTLTTLLYPEFFASGSFFLIIFRNSRCSYYRTAIKWTRSLYYLLKVITYPQTHSCLARGNKLTSVTTILQNLRSKSQGASPSIVHASGCPTPLYLRAFHSE